MKSGVIALLAVSCLASCVNHRQLANFNTGPEFPAGATALPPAPDLRIQPDDLLEIGVFAEDPAAVAPFTLHGANSQQPSANVVNGHQYLVDQTGSIDFPVLGKLQLAGWNLEQARDSIQARLEKYIGRPIVHVRRLNFKFTVLGEVNHPGAFTLQEHKVSILEAIGMAGDLTNYGNREHILVIREQDGRREFGYINLRDRSVFLSPYYYVMQNDVLYVEPIKQKTGVVSDQATTKALPWVSAGAIVVNIFILLFR